MKIQSKDNIIKDLSNKYSHIIGDQPQQNQTIEKIIINIVNYYNDIIDCLPGNVYWYDKNCNAIECNRNVLDMLNLKSVSDFKGLSFEEMGKLGGWTQEAMQSFKRDTLEVLISGKPKLNVDEPPIPHHDGRIVYFLTSRVPLFNQTGEVIGVVGISVDITERKQMELALLKAKEDAETANKLKIEFIHNMEHDIRTPFSGIYGIAKMLTDQETDAAKKDLLNDIVCCSKELLDYSTGILDFSMIESGSLPIVSKKFSLKKLIDGLIAMETPPAKVKGIEFLAYSDEDVPAVVMGDRYRLQRILINLLSNAIKFTEKGFVHLSVKLVKRLDHRHVALSFCVKDSGMGIPLEKQNLLFERFSRLTPSNQGQYSGHGLGLRIVKQFVEEMDGDIEIESLVDQGTSFVCTFLFKLPITDTIIGEKDEEQEAELRNGIRVLVVEDHVVAQKIAVSLLKNLNCHVDLAGNGKKAMELLSKNTYDIILLDIGLPDIDGFQLTEAIRNSEKNKKPTSIIALTAHTEENYKHQCVEAGMNDCFTKPLTVEVAKNILVRWSPGADDCLNVKAV